MNVYMSLAGMAHQAYEAIDRDAESMGRFVMFLNEGECAFMSYDVAQFYESARQQWCTANKCTHRAKTLTRYRSGATGKEYTILIHQFLSLEAEQGASQISGVTMAAVLPVVGRLVRCRLVALEFIEHNPDSPVPAEYNEFWRDATYDIDCGWVECNSGVRDARLRCSRCHVIYYCSPECQRADYKKHHKKFCKPLAECMKEAAEEEKARLARIEEEITKDMEDAIATANAVKSKREREAQEKKINHS